MADLLAELRAERAKHAVAGDVCAACWVLWPCPMARALDCAIVLAEAAWALQSHHVDEGGTKVVRDAWTAAAAAWKGEPRG